MAVTQETITLSDYSDKGIKTQVRRRTTSRGTSERVSIDIDAEPLVAHFNELALGAGPAEALKNAIAKKIKSYGEIVSDATLAKRDYYHRAWNSGRVPKSVKKRFSGGRIGATPPPTGSQAPRKWNHSSRLADGLFVRQNPKEGTFAINCPANRFTEGNSQHLAAQLVSDVGLSAQELAEDPAFDKAVNESLELIIAKGADINDARRVARRQEILNSAKATFGLFRALAAL